MARDPLLCDACGGRGGSGALLLRCNCCGVKVHVGCAFRPGSQAAATRSVLLWHCEACSAGEVTPDLRCCLCGERGGAMQRLKHLPVDAAGAGGGWAHVVCRQQRGSAGVIGGAAGGAHLPPETAALWEQCLHSDGEGGASWWDSPEASPRRYCSSDGDASSTASCSSPVAGADRRLHGFEDKIGGFRDAGNAHQHQHEGPLHHQQRPPEHGKNGEREEQLRPASPDTQQMQGLKRKRADGGDATADRISNSSYVASTPGKQRPHQHGNGTASDEPPWQRDCNGTCGGNGAHAAGVGDACMARPEQGEHVLLMLCVCATFASTLHVVDLCMARAAVLT
jgi:hypothetical protein